MKRTIDAVIWILKLLVKLIMLPVIIGLTLAECICSVAACITTQIFGLIGFIIIITAILSAGFVLEKSPEVWRMIVTGVGFCLAPLLVEWLAIDLAMVNLRLKSWFLG